MTSFLTKMIGDKKHWKRMEARAAALPSDYRSVYGAIKSYLWRFASGDGSDVVRILDDVLALFEDGAAEGKAVLEATGEDVAAFCDERLQGANPYDSFLDQWRTALNQDVKKKL